MLVVRRKRKRETRDRMSVQREQHVGPSPACGRPDTMWIDEAEGEVRKLDWRPKKNPARGLQRVGTVHTQIHSRAQEDETPSEPSDPYILYIHYRLVYLTVR